MTEGTLYDETVCELGEGPLWHPERQQLFWFDILGKRLLTRDGGETRIRQFDDHVSAAGWIDRDRLLIASERALFVHDLATGASETVAPLEDSRPGTRSNDGRADPWGGFWIGTMGKAAEPRAGAIYRYYRGEVRLLRGAMTIPNAICFSPERRFAYYTDTPTRTVMRQPLSPRDGWPRGEAETWLDLTEQGLNPDGAVVDAEGCVWIAQWGAARVARYGRDGGFIEAIGFPALHTSCPAFGGPDLSRLFCTTAREHLSDADIAREPRNGMTFASDTEARGQPEHRVIL